MAQAAKSRSTIAPIRRDPAHDARVLNAVQDLESQVCDSAHMSAIAATMIEDAIGEVGGEIDEHGRIVFRFTKAAIEELLFGVIHAQSMSEALREQFYAALETP